MIGPLFVSTIYGMSSGMFEKQDANALVNVLGAPMHAQLIDTDRHPQCLRACIQVNVAFSYPQSIPYIIDEGLIKMLVKLKFSYNTKASRCTKCVRFGHLTHCCLVTKLVESSPEYTQVEHPLDDEQMDQHINSPSDMWEALVDYNDK